MEHSRRVKESKKQRREQERRAKRKKTPTGSRQTIKTNRQAEYSTGKQSGHLKFFFQTA